MPLLMMALIGTLAYEFPVVLPLLAHQTLHGGATTFGFLSCAMGAGAVAGGLVVAVLAITGLQPLTTAAGLFGSAMVAAAIVPTLPGELAAMALVGQPAPRSWPRATAHCSSPAIPASADG